MLSRLSRLHDPVHVQRFRQPLPHATAPGLHSDERGRIVHEVSMSESSANEPLQDRSQTDPAEREVPVEDSPVPTGPATLPMGAHPWQGPDRLVLRAPFWRCASTFLGFLLAAGTVAGIILVVVDWRQGLLMPLVFGLLFGLPIVLSGRALFYRQLLLPQVTFDKEAGVLTLGWKGLRGQRPLASVLGVQVMQTRMQFAGPEHAIAAVTMYQMNLILDDPDERRLNVLTADAVTVRSTARLVADFLGVPVLDSAGTVPATGMPMPGEHCTVPSPMVTELGPDLLVIQPRRLALLFGARHAVMGLAATLLAAMSPWGGGMHWFFVPLAGMLACSVLLQLVFNLNRRACFDRAQGELTLGWLRRRAPRPLSAVKAVEIVEGDQHQLNLLPNEADRPRINLITDVDAGLVRRAAERVASFLSVPLVDARRSAPAVPRPGGSEEPVNLLGELSRSPLHPGKASVRGRGCVVVKGGDVLVLRPRFRLVAWLGLLLAWLATGVGLWLLWDGFGRAGAQAGFGQWWHWLFLLLMGPSALFGALKLLLWHRDRFDRQTGRLTLDWFGLKGTYPLAKVLAVQLIPGGLVHKPVGPGGRGGERVSYQMNLVMADVHEDRLHLTDSTDLEWNRRAGQQIADFLGVPLLDQIADGDRRSAG
jgi:hypothetical protein